jgi:RNA polymerase sigma-70 factor (ECF subfamily)
VSLEDDLVGEVPNLRAFARSLALNHAVADDLVQETILKAWSNLDSYQRGTNLRAWLFTILRNTFISLKRKYKREVEDAEGAHAARVVQIPEQEGAIALAEFRRALSSLPIEQREAIVLVGAEGFTYDEAAKICGCAIGTVKSRVNRARKSLSEQLNPEPDDPVSPTTGTTGAPVPASDRSPP